MHEGRNLFERFGGVRPMADVLDEPPSTVQSWKNTGRIPSTKQPDVLARAEQHGFAITAEDVVFPLKRRPDICPPSDVPVSSPAGDTASVAPGAPFADCDRGAPLQRSARA